MAGQNVQLPRRLVHFHRVAVPSGVMIVSLEPGSPAERAGLKPGDVIVEFADKPVASIDDLQRLLSSDCVGAATEIKVVRTTEIHVLRIVPAESPKRN
jgi:S1-C subfamily serine protease